MSQKFSGYFIRLAILFFLYYSTARYGLELDAVNGFATLVWAPSGIALSVLLLYGYRLWPGIFAAATIVNSMVGAPLPVAIGIGVGNTLEAALGTFLLHRFQFRPSLDRLEDLVKFVVLAAFLGTLVSATTGTASLWVGEVIPSTSTLRTWATWWLGDAMGALIVAPFALVWKTKLPPKLDRIRRLEAIALVLIGSAVCEEIFIGSTVSALSSLHQRFLVYPILIWAATRFHQHGVTAMNLLMSGLAIWGTVHRHGPFSVETLTLSDNLSSLQAFLATVTLTSLALAALLSERRERENNLERMVEESKSEKASFAAVVEKLGQEREIRERFVATLSHDLRNPLTVAKTGAQMLLRSNARTKESWEKLSSRVIVSIDRADQMIQDLLDANRIRAGQRIPFQVSLCNIKSIAQDAIDELSLVHGDRFVLETPERAIAGHWYGASLRRIIENLLDNAVKYGDPRAKITVLLHQSDNHVQIAVHNEGKALTQEEQTTIFEPFSRAKSAEQQKGWGLGLTLVRGISEAHGGRVSVSSSPERGTTFSVELPLDSRPFQTGSSADRARMET